MAKGFRNLFKNIGIWFSMRVVEVIVVTIVLGSILSFYEFLFLSNELNASEERIFSTVLINFGLALFMSVFFVIVSLYGLSTLAVSMIPILRAKLFNRKNLLKLYELHVLLFVGTGAILLIWEDGLMSLMYFSLYIFESIAFLSGFVGVIVTQKLFAPVFSSS